MARLVTLSDEDKEFLKNVCKSDLQRKEDKLEEAHRKIYHLEEELYKCRKVLNDIVHLYYEKGCFTVMLDAPKAQIMTITDEFISPDFVRTIDIPIDRLVVDAIKQLMGEIDNEKR